MRTLKHVAVLGSGTMGSGIAAFFANQGITADLYDINEQIVQDNLRKLADPKAKVPLLYTPRFLKKIQPRVNSEMAEHLGKADLIVEVVPENMELKKQVFAEIDRFRRDDAIVATNTSGLSIAQMAAGTSASLQEHFLGTHYFNPVRFLPLVELVPTPQTSRQIVDFMAEFLRQAGKKPIVCRDTPNFVANRIGIYSLMKTLQLMAKYRFDVETIDMITGTAIGNPKTGTLRLCDLVGIDVVFAVADNLYQNCADECHEIFAAPAFLKRMVDEGMLGEKTKKGFYRKDEKRRILALNLESWQYNPAKDPRSDVVKVAKGHQNVRDRVYAMVKGEDSISMFCRELLLSTAAYALNRVGEIATDIATIDNGVKWGFNREIGPIEILDSFGLAKARSWMQDLSIAVPPLLDDIEANTREVCDHQRHPVAYYDIESKTLKQQPLSKDTIHIRTLREAGKTVRENLSARLLDLDDGALLLQIDSPMVPTMNPIDEFVVSMMQQAIALVASGDYKCLVIGNQAANFCAGANLQLLLELCKQQQWDKIRQSCADFQNANMALYHAPFPVVVAPHGMTLGGGMEISLTGHKRVAAAELYGGLVEVGVGLLPGGAGNLMLLLQFIDNLPNKPGPFPPAMKSLELIAYGAVSSSAHDAISKGYLTRNDEIILDQDAQIKRAKEVALKLVEGFQPRLQRQLVLSGEGGYLAMEHAIDELFNAGKVPPHGAFVAKKIAWVLNGGSKASPTHPVSEDYMLELEREAFLSLCGEEKTQQRIGYMLKNKKPLMN